MTVSWQGARFRLALCLLCTLGLSIRILLHSDRSWKGDEWGTILALKLSYRSLFTHFGQWNTMNFYLAGLKAMGQFTTQPNWILATPSIVCGCWLIVLAAAIALRLGSGTRGAIFAAALVVVNPYLVYYSVEIRSYIFLAAFSSAMLLYFLDWQITYRRRDAALCAFFGALSLLMSLSAVYSLAAITALVLIWIVPRLKHRQPDAWRPLGVLAVPAVILVGLAAAAYIPQIPDIRRFQAKWSDTPPTPLTFLPQMTSLYFGQGYLVLPAIGAILYASWRVIRDRRPGQILLVTVIVPLTVISLTGVSHYPHAFARFLLAILPWMIILMADGLAAASSRSGQLLAIMALLAVAASGLESHLANYRAMHSAPWHRLAAALRKEMTPDQQCFVLGQAVNATALRAYDIQATTSIVKLLAAAPADQPCKVFLVDAASLLDPKADVQLFGQLRLLRLTGTPRQLGERICADLLAGTGQRIDPALVGPYLQTAQLLVWLGRPEEAQTYEHIAAVSRAHNWAQSLPQHQPKTTPVAANE